MYVVTLLTYTVPHCSDIHCTTLLTYTVPHCRHTLCLRLPGHIKLLWTLDHKTWRDTIVIKPIMWHTVLGNWESETGKVTNDHQQKSCSTTLQQINASVTFNKHHPKELHCPNGTRFAPTVTGLVESSAAWSIIGETRGLMWVIIGERQPHVHHSSCGEWPYVAVLAASIMSQYYVMI